MSLIASQSALQHAAPSLLTAFPAPALCALFSSSVRHSLLVNCRCQIRHSSSAAPRQISSVPFSLSPFRRRSIQPTFIRPSLLIRHFSSSPPPPSSTSLISSFPSSVRSVTEVANPRLLSPPSFVSDAAHLLFPSESSHLSSVLASLKSSTGAEVAVVTLSSCPSPTRPFAISLFNHWGIGNKATNTGVLLLIDKDNRRVEIVTGEGAVKEYGLTDEVIQRLLDEGMVPWLRKGEWGKAVIGGVGVLDAIIRASPAGKAGAVKADGEGGGGGWGGGGAKERLSKAPEVNPSWIKWLVAAGIGFIFFLPFFFPSSPSSPSSTSACPKCQGELQPVGIIDASNLPSSSPLSEVARSDAPLPTSPPPLVFVPSNLFSSDYSIDYRQILEGMGQEERKGLAEGKVLDVKVCQDCGTLYVEPRMMRKENNEGRRGRGEEWTAEYVGPVGVRGLREETVGEGRRAVVWLPQQPHQKGVRREQIYPTVSTTSSSSGFGGGSTSGGGGGASF